MNVLNGTWKRRCPGEYLHVETGWTISRVECHPHYGGGTHWVAVNPRGYSPFDPFPTLADAKWAVDEVLSN